MVYINNMRVHDMSFGYHKSIDTYTYFVKENEELQARSSDFHSIHKAIISEFTQDGVDCEGGEHINPEDIVQIYGKNTCALVKIADNAFANCEKLKSVVLPTVTTIGTNAFESCLNLSQMKLSSIPTAVIENNHKTWGIDDSLTLDIEGSDGIYHKIPPKEEPAILFTTDVTRAVYRSLEQSIKETSQTLIDGSELSNDIITGISYDDGCTCCTEIKPGAFQSLSSNTTLTTVDIPYGVLTIGNAAFYNCEGINSITIPNSVTSIGSVAFFNCSNLESITIPASLTTTIGNRAFDCCRSLKSITVDENSTMYKDVDGVLFSKDCSTLVQYPIGKTSGIYEIPEEVLMIGNYAFNNCTNLNSISIPGTVFQIGEGSFAYCVNMTMLIIENTGIGIDSYAFDGCEKLDTIVYNGTVATWNSSSISSYFGKLTSVEGSTTAGKASGGTWRKDGKTSGAEISVTFNSASSSYLLFTAKDSSGATTTYTSDEDTITKTEQTLLDGSKLSNSSITEISYQGYGSFNKCTSVADSAFYSNKVLNTVNLPDSVTSIGKQAFYYCTSLSSLDLGNGLNSIGDNAFVYCKGLTGTLTLPDNVTSIGNWAFSNCSGLTGTLTIPKGVTSIGTSAFYRCSSLEFITVNSENTSYKDIDGVLFTYDGTTLHTCPAGKSDTSYTIPDSTIKICNNAFYGCRGLTGTLTIPSSVTSIGSKAFSYCTSLTTVNIPGITGANKNTSWFKYCTQTIRVTMSDSKWDVVGETWTEVTEPVEEPALLFASEDGTYRSNEQVIKTTSQTLIEGQIDGNELFNDEITSISYEPGCTCCTSVAESAFAADYFSPNKILKTISLSDTVTSIGSSAFFCCTGLTSVDLGKGVESIGKSAFSNCSGLTSITIPDSVTSIGDSAFSNCSGLTGTLTLPSSLTSIGSSAFSGCKGLTGLTLPSKLTSIGKSAFYNCKGLKAIILPDSVTSIGGSAFSSCSNLTSVSIPDTVTSIGSSAFQQCSGLTSITIPNTVTSIGEDAFLGCNVLASIIFNGTKDSWNSNTALTEYFGILADDGSISGGSFSQIDTKTKVTYINGEDQIITVTWNVNDGDDTIITTKYTFGDSVGSMLPPGPLRTGYTFNGWYTDTTYTTQVTADTCPMESTTYYAKWSAIEYTITYDLDGHGELPGEVKTAYTIEDDEIIPPTLTCDGWTFDGWSPSSIPSGSYGDVTFTASWVQVEQDEESALITNRTDYDITIQGVTDSKSYTIPAGESVQVTKQQYQVTSCPTSGFYLGDDKDNFYVQGDTIIIDKDVDISVHVYEMTEDDIKSIQDKYPLTIDIPSDDEMIVPTVTAPTVVDDNGESSYYGTDESFLDSTLSNMEFTPMRMTLSSN